MIFWAKKSQPKRTRGVFYGQLPTLSPRVPFFQREKAAYIKIRRQGVSINQIAEAFGRSTSAVFRVIKNAEGLETLRSFDKRKLPASVRRRSASFRHQILMKLLPRWERWIAGDGDEPP